MTGRASTGRESWIVVPASDEQDHIVEGLRAIEQAAAAAPGPVHVVVVDDGSTDQTAALATRTLARWPGRHTVLAGPAEGVGWARRVGIEHALTAIAGGAPGTAQDLAGTALVATTDADSRVDPAWLATMHRRLDEGHVVIAGDVHLHPATDERLVAARATRLAARLAALPTDERPAPHPHFAGSSLGFRSDVLASLGALPTPVALEDEAILLRCRERGVPVLRDHACVVVTSARLDGRAPAGLAAALTEDLRVLGPVPT
jgi:glycosyltransferase involved in cell wall biosynthesis